MALFVDTSVWSLALRRAAEADVPEVRALKNALTEGWQIVTTGTKKTDVTLGLGESIARRWAKENRESIAAFNKEIAERGVWSEGIRSW